MTDECVVFDTLENTDIVEIHKAFILAFSDYSVTLDMPIEKFRSFLHSNGFEPSLSAGAFADGSLCGFVLNGIRDADGVRTAYDGGTGVIPGMRKKGLTKGMFAFLLPMLKSNGVRRYALEVIQSNEPALNLYKNMGFTVTRELSCQRAKKDDIVREGAADVIRTADVSGLDEEKLSTFWDYIPTWQNTFYSIKAEPERCAAVIAERSGEVIGYGVINAESGRVYQLAVKKDMRGKGLGSGILHALAFRTSASNVTFLNVDSGCKSMLSFLNRQGFEEYVKQYEMELDLR